MFSLCVVMIGLGRVHVNDALEFTSEESLLSLKVEIYKPVDLIYALNFLPMSHHMVILGQGWIPLMVKAIHR